MNTCEMVLLADKNGKTYIANDMYYQRDKGFHEDNGNTWDADAFTNYQENGKYELNAFVHIDNWEQVKKRSMTLEEIEEKLGYEVEIVD